MSCGRVVCGKCLRDLHQSASREVENGWRHSEDGTPRCDGATTDYAVHRGLPDFPPFEFVVEIGRNHPCHCGSGRKYKKCCMNKETA